MIKTSHVAFASLAVALCVGSAQATWSSNFTPVQAPPSGERDQRWILGQTFGGTFTRQSNGVDFANGSGITAQRLIDRGVPAPTSLSVPTTTRTGDIRWTGPSLSRIVVEAKFAGHNSTFGFFDDASPETGFQAITNTSNLNTPIDVSLPASFRWALRNNTTGRMFTSLASGNPGGADHLISYRMSGGGLDPNTGRFMLFWEDLNKVDCSDWDFNDAAIQITATPIPAPGATALLAGTGLIALRRRRR